MVAGCDDVPLSGLKLDSCKVCGGDNSTCSGCDGIPNTGKDRSCSGHGECFDGSCKCTPNYFGEFCSNFCDQEPICSGHGQCNFDDGLSCFCSEGWQSIAKQYPGPFCDLLDGRVSGGSVGSQTGIDGDTWDLILVQVTVECVSEFVFYLKAISHDFVCGGFEWECEDSA